MTSQPSLSRPRYLPNDHLRLPRLRRRSRAWLAEFEASLIVVRTWCRACGEPFIVNLPPDYHGAVARLHRLDDQEMQHVDHDELGGWGVHLRFDDILDLVFPGHREVELFGVPIWYQYDINYSLEAPIKILRTGKVLS
jgi:hypothetical protein